MPVQIRPSQLPLCPQTSPCNTGSCCCSHLHGRDCPISQVSTRRDTSHLSCTQELWSQAQGNYHQQVLERAGNTARLEAQGASAARSGLCCGKELGSGVQVESMESGSQMAQHTEHGQNPMQADRNMALGKGELPLTEPNSTATTTFGLLMIPC